ncbi:hypothetical protein EG343_08445 [Chryseobacterium nakagawai]|uniref:dTDP-4-amino-4,6-dideoxygalactose transaminase n=1 Tax=Chryseobacterium nakagawai TaxID=1241982 RepID=A0AAD1DQF1_CHRNA|nr:hypothetical protein [Chryseobacterium nakagawai]AZA90651.1 hypothetical protein EG343_08445 [Chryseobacterium nakagawai]
MAKIDMYKEFGSGFHYIHSQKKNENFFEKNDNYHLYFSGRVALYNLLKFGIKTYNWNKVGFPSYYCHEVVGFFADLDIEILYYDYNPEANNKVIWEDDSQSVIINVLYFGQIKADLTHLRNTVIIDDLTHDLAGFNKSTADYCFASLRKQLPLGIGGMCKYKNGENIDTDPDYTTLAEKTYIKVLSAMFLKEEYLLNNLENNDLYRRYYLEAEDTFKDPLTDSLMPSQAELILSTFPVEEILRKTGDNISLGAGLIKKSSKFEVIPSRFCLLLIFKDPTNRNQLRQFLIDNKVFPAVLWPNQLNSKDKDLESRILNIHMDFRYSEQEIEYIANKVNSFFENV